MPVFTRENIRILFVHVPKTGGTSVERFFHRNGFSITHRDGNLGRNTDNWYRRCSPQHMHASILRELFRIERFDAVFMTVRHPVDRFRSEYGMYQGSTVSTSPTKFEQWTVDTLEKAALDPYVYDNHIRPQDDFYVPGSIVYKLEDGLDGLVDDLNKRLDLNLTGEMPQALSRKEKSGTPSTLIEVSAEIRMRLQDVYKRDFSKFDYETV